MKFSELIEILTGFENVVITEQITKLEVYQGVVGEMPLCDYMTYRDYEVECLSANHQKSRLDIIVKFVKGCQYDN